VVNIESKVGRFDAFYALETDKRQRIIDAAITEFADKGFKKASTNAIATNAKIGKGMLFYYFGSKDELYDFLCEYAIEFIKREVIDKISGLSDDFIERQSTLAKEKRRAMDSNRNIFELFESLYKPENAEQAAKYYETLESYRKDFYRRMYEGVDFTLFRADIAPRDAMKYIVWLLDGYSQEIIRKILSGEIKDPVEWDKFDNFVGDLRKLFYK
jgi:AcrR family transcriptional regulator